MIVDIRGTDTINKGAELMRIAIVQALSPEFSLSCAPGLDDYFSRSRLGLLQTLDHGKYPRMAALVGKTLPSAARRRFGIVAAATMHGAVDASGYAYSSDFPAWRTEKEVLVARQRDSSAPLILLPQAFGRVFDSEHRFFVRELLERSRLVYARDRESLRYVHEYGVNVAARLSPDFTIGLEGKEGLEVPKGDWMAVVPNGKLVSTGKVEPESYRRTMGGWITAAAEAGLEPVMVVHEHTDARFAAEVASQHDIRLLGSSDPLLLKGALGKANVVLASRFHAAVSALSQAVPTFTFGWSHKYGALMADFDVADMDLSDGTDARRRLAELDVPSVRDTLSTRKRDLVAQIEEMWVDVREALHGAG